MRNINDLNGTLCGKRLQNNCALHLHWLSQGCHAQLELNFGSHRHVRHYTEPFISWRFPPSSLWWWFPILSNFQKHKRGAKSRLQDQFCFIIDWFLLMRGNTITNENSSSEWTSVCHLCFPKNRHYVDILNKSALWVSLCVKKAILSI